MSTLFAILSSLIRVYTICHSQPSDQGLHCHSEQSDQGLHYSICYSKQSDQGQGPLSPTGTVWSRSTLFAILRRLIMVYTISNSFWAVLSSSTLFAIFSCLIRVYTICQSQQSDQGLHCFPFSAVWSGSTLFAIHSLIRAYTIFHSF